MDENAAPRGRPTLLDEELLKRAETFLGECPILSALAADLEVSERTVRRWHRWGRVEQERREADHEPNPRRNPHVRFCHVLKKARASWQRRYLAPLERGEPQWQSRAWILERLWPDEFGSDARRIAELERRIKELERDGERASPRPSPSLSRPNSSANGHG